MQHWWTYEKTIKNLTKLILNSFVCFTYYRFYILQLLVYVQLRFYFNEALVKSKSEVCVRVCVCVCVYSHRQKYHHPW